jgi:hypothetical protein
MEKPCSCAGSNPNCSKCGGLGSYLPRTEFPMIKRTGRRRQGIASPTSSRRSIGHRAVPAPKVKSPKDSASQPLSDTSNRTMTCPLCELRLERAEFLSHLESVHRTTWKLAEKSLDDAYHGTAFTFQTYANEKRKLRIVCPFCQSPFSQGKIGQHLESAHQIGPIRFVKELPQSKQSKRSLRSAPSPMQKVESPPKSADVAHRVSQTGSEDSQDANRYIGFFARENGRYGSHPLHDRYDDESVP